MNFKCENGYAEPFAKMSGARKWVRCGRNATHSVGVQFKTEYEEGRQYLCERCASVSMLPTKLIKSNSIIYGKSE